MSSRFLMKLRNNITILVLSIVFVIILAGGLQYVFADFPIGGVFYGINGSATIPSHTFATSNNDGGYLVSAGTLGWTTAGTQRATLASTGFATSVPINITSTSATALTVAAAGTNYGLQVDESTGSAVTGLKIKSGIAGGGLALSLINGNAAENMKLDAEGTGTLTLQGTATGNIIIGNGQLLSPDGTTTNPSFSFSNATSTGMYQSGNTLRFSSNNSLKEVLDSEGIQIQNGQVLKWGLVGVSNDIYLTRSAASILNIGATNGTNPAFQIDQSIGSAVTGMLIRSNIAGSGLAASVIGGNATENYTTDAKGAGTYGINTIATGNITLGRATTISTGGLTVTGTTTLNTSPLNFTAGAQMIVGTTDNNALMFKTNNGNVLQLDTSGNLNFQQASSITTTVGALTLAPVSGSNLVLTVAGAGTIPITGNTSIAGLAVSGGATTLGITPGAHTSVTAETTDFNLVAHTITETGAIATQRFARFQQPTITSSAQTATTAVTVNIDAAPTVASTSVITNDYALQVGGAVTVAGTAGTIYAAVNIPAHTVTDNTATQITSNPSILGMNIGQITIAQSGGAVDVGNTATLNLGIPTHGASVTAASSRGMTIGGNYSFGANAAGASAGPLRIGTHTATLLNATQLTATPSLSEISLGTFTINQSGGAVIVNSAAALHVNSNPVAGTSVTLTASYGILINASAATTGTITTAYGISVGAVSGASTNNYGIYVNTPTGTGAVGLTVAGAGASITGNTSILSGTFAASGGIISLNVSSNFAVNIATGTSTGAVTIGNSAAGIMTLANKANTAATFLITDGTNNQYALDTRTGITGIKTHTFGNTAPSFASATGNTYSLVALNAYTITQTGSTLVTALDGLSQTIGSPTVTDASALTVTTASSHYVNGPIPAGSVTFTNSYSSNYPTFVTNGTTAANINLAAPTGATNNFTINIASGAIGLNGSAGTTGYPLLSGGSNTLPTWGGAMTLNSTLTMSTLTANAPVYSGAGGLISASAAITNTLGSDVTLTTAGTYYDGPSCANATAGTWFASGLVEVTGTASDIIKVKLWDGTNAAVASAQVELATVTGTQTSIPISGKITTPAGNIRISVTDATTSTTPKIVFNQSGLSADSTLTCERIG